jgi:hypothetical protein
MQILDIIRSAQGGQLVANLARQFGMTPEQANAMLEAVLPQLSAGIERNTLSRGGLADLVEALGHGHHARALDDPRALTDPATIEDGNNILGHILGSKDGSRAVAQRAASSTGLSESLIKMLLPILASILMGSMSKGVGGGLGDILGKIGGARPGGASGGGQGGGMSWPQQMPREGRGGGFELPQSQSGGGSGMGIPMPDGRRESEGGSPGGWGNRNQDNDTNSGSGGGFGIPGLPRQSGGGYGGQQGSGQGGGMGLPMPGGRVPGVPGDADNPFGDLSDIIRRGTSGGGSGVSVPGMSGGLWSIVRGLIGNSLGFGNRGVMGWIMNLIIMRFAWPLLRTVLGRVLMGR